jgi:hypothetical protein
MSIDRKAGPTGVPIAQLDFPHTPAKNLGNGINGWLYPTPGTGVARLYVVFPGGARMVPEPWTLSAAAQLQLSGNDLYSAAAIQEKIEALAEGTVQKHRDIKFSHWLKGAISFFSASTSLAQFARTNCAICLKAVSPGRL